MARDNKSLIHNFGSLCSHFYNTFVKSRYINYLLLESLTFTCVKSSLLASLLFGSLVDSSILIHQLNVLIFYYISKELGTVSS